MGREPLLWHVLVVLCSFCHQPLVYVHGHAACVDNRCPMYGLNQVECCDGETADNVVASTPEVTALPKLPELPEE